jgi:hypothetical protein
MGSLFNRDLQPGPSDRLQNYPSLCSDGSGTNALPAATPACPSPALCKSAPFCIVSIPCPPIDPPSSLSLYPSFPFPVPDAAIDAWYRPVAYPAWYQAHSASCSSSSGVWSVVSASPGAIGTIGGGGGYDRC